MIRESLRSTCLEADTRGLAVFRIVFGCVMLGYLIVRSSGDSLVAFLTNDGVLPNHHALFAPVARHHWSLLFAFSTRGQVLACMALFGLAFTCFTVGYRTKLAQLASLASLVSIHYRMPMVVNASMILMHILCVWTLALPLGRHYSMDAVLARRRGARPSPLPNERVTSLAVLGFRLQLFAIYFFNVAHKTGATWRDGTAVHYVLLQDRIALPSAVWLREHEPRWLSPVATSGTLALETIIAIAVVVPVFPTIARRTAAVAIVVLHAGIGLFVNLGPFPFVLSSAALLLMAGGDWSRFPSVLREALARARRARPADAVLGSEPSRGSGPRSGLARGLGEAWNAVALVCIALLVRHDAPTLRSRLGPSRLPRFAEVFGETLYVPQGWALFAPEAPRTDGVLVIDAVRWNGRHVDPLRHAAPDFAVFEHGPFGTDSLWQTYQPLLVTSERPDLWRLFVDYLERIPALERWPGDPRFRSIRVYYVHGTRPPWRAPPSRPAVQLVAERVYVPDDPGPREER